MHTLFSPRVTLSVLSFSLLLLAPGCSSHRRDDLEFPDPKQVARPAMLGEDAFFENKVLVELSLGRGFRPRPRRNRDYTRHGDGINQVYSIDDAGNRSDMEPTDEYFIPRMNNSSLPPVALRMRVTNQGTEPIDVEFVECRSYLGNFAVRPEKATVAPGASGQPDPMTSLLGVTSDEIPVTIGLRIGGKLETKVVPLRTVKGAPPVTQEAKP